MRTWIIRGFVLLVIAAITAFIACQRVTDPKNSTATPFEIEIEHLSVGAAEIEAMVDVDDPGTIGDVLGLLSVDQLAALAQGHIIHVEDPALALKVAKASGLDTSNPATAEGGLLLADCDMTWAELKCCYGGHPECCCPKKKEQ
jgi:hypothetical protein